VIGVPIAGLRANRAGSVTPLRRVTFVSFAGGTRHGREVVTVRTPVDTDGKASPSPLLEVANVMVHLYKNAFGRGPTRSRALFSGSDTIVVLLEDMMTGAERQLVALGEHGRVREQRLFLQLAFEDTKRFEVERILRRRVVASICGTDPARDLATEVFVLEPRA
jgi:uncharacterized protein YbcI